MQYHTQDVRLDVPDTKAEDSSMNIIKFPELGTSLVITRGVFGAGKTLIQSFDDQIRRLQQRMQGFKSQGRRELNIGVDGGIAAVEIQNQFRRDKETVFQFQVACAYPGKERMLVLSYVKNSPLSEADRQHWEAFKASVQFNAPRSEA